MSSNEENPEYFQVIAILKKLGKESLLHIFQSNELTDDALDDLETPQDMRDELKSVTISSGAAIKFSTSWFSRKESGQNVPTKSKEASSEVASVTQSSKGKIKCSQKPGHFTSKEHDANENNTILLKVKENREESKPSGEDPATELQGTENQTLPKKMEQKRKKEEKLLPTSRYPTDNTQRATATTRVRRQQFRRPFKKPAENFRYVRGNVFLESEDKTIEFKALTDEKLSKLPWKIMDKARPFICGILNGGEQGTIYFGIGDSYDPLKNYERGEIIGLEVEDLKDEICKAFQSTLNDHIKSDNRKMTKGGDMNCIKIYFVPVWESDERTRRYVVEIEVKREWMFCEDNVYYFQKWTEKRENPSNEKSELKDLYKIEKDKWKDPVIRTCASTDSVKGIDTAKQVKEPLSQKYKKWQDDAKGKSQKGMHSQDPENIQKLSSNVRKSLRELQFKETSYILIANKVPDEYGVRGTKTLAFLQKIPWIAVFDLFDQSTFKDGLYYIMNETNDCATPTKKDLETFKDLNISEPILTVGTTWITRSEKMNESSWIRYSKDCLYTALKVYHKQSLTGHVHCVFLLLSDKNLQEMADIVDSSFSIIGNDANKRISIISERLEFGTEMIKFLKDDIIKDIKPPCSVFGVSFDLLRDSVEVLLGSVEFNGPEETTELPYLDGKLRPVRNKRIKSLTDLEIYVPHPNLDGEWEDITKAKENFYMGNVITQLNLFHMDAIERTLEKKLTRYIDECLRNLSSPEEIELYVTTVTLRYESGSGATTLGRQILWKKREDYRCAAVKKISDETDYQISELQKFSYASETSPSFVPPVLILVDNIPEKQVHNLSEMLTRRGTKCVLLGTVPIDQVTEDNDEDFTLGKLDDTEISKVRGVLSNLHGERKEEAAKVLDRERRFVWLGLELFGREYADIEHRLSKHIHQVLSQTDQLIDAYQMILHFCCLLDHYSKGRCIYPKYCVEGILSLPRDPEMGSKKNIDEIHEKFGGILLEDFNKSVGYYGWRPAHALVGEVVLKTMDLLKTAKKLVEEMNKGDTYLKKYLIEDTVSVFLQREKIRGNGADGEDDTYEDDFLGIMEIKTRYSPLILDILSKEDQSVIDALDLLIALEENVQTDQQKAYTFQQIARMFAYEIGINELSNEVRPLVKRINETVSPENRLRVSPENGFDIAHQVIDEAIKVQKSYVHHLVTKATFYRVKLQNLHDKNSLNTIDPMELKIVIENAVKTTKAGIFLYDDVLIKKNRDSYLHAMIAKSTQLLFLCKCLKSFHFSHNIPMVKTKASRPMLLLVSILKT